MPNLILHVGPAKCGSSSIQKFFAEQKRPCIQRTRYKLLDPADITALNQEDPCKKVNNKMNKIIRAHLRCDALILSHEYLFQCPLAIRNICNLAKKSVRKISIIGYSRKQSDRMVSAYSQWEFRSPDLVKEKNEILKTIDIDPILFSGLERNLIANIVSDFGSAEQTSNTNIIDWYHSYKTISERVTIPDLEIICGFIPIKDQNSSLIQDFCKRCGLTLRDKRKNAGKEIVNLKFNQDIVEAINNAVDFGFDMPGPHRNNSVLQQLSNMSIRQSQETKHFLTSLKGYIDTYFLNSNRRLCREYELNEEDFAPAVQLSKTDIMDIIVREGQRRAANKSDIIHDYRMLSARMVELCLRVMKDGKCQ